MQSKEKFNKWRDNYIKEQKSYRNKNILKLSLLLFLFTIIGFLAYYKWIGELKFVGKKVTYVNAKIITENRIHIGEGLYKQSGKCEFDFNNKKYTTQFKTKDWRKITNTKQFEIGDFIKLKISTENPLISKFIE